MVFDLKLWMIAGLSALFFANAAHAQIRITEWMYSGSGGEFVELTNVGEEPVDMAGWSYDDDSATPGVFDLSGFGMVEPGESVVFTESDPEAFRSNWGLCAGVKIIGPYSNNIGRNDQINIFGADDELADRLTYGDGDFPGSIRTQNISGWVSKVGLGADDVYEWTLSEEGDGENSFVSAAGEIGSPGGSARAGTAYDPCAAAQGQIRITEWMYSGDGGEFVELTNVGGEPVDVLGWSYDDDSATPGVFDLSGFGMVQPGESVVFTESDPEAFRANWGLCAGIKIIGPYSNNIGRNDQINIFGADDKLVDRLTYGDGTFPGSIRTQGASGWVSEAGLGADDVYEWTLSEEDDSEDSFVSAAGEIGSPGGSMRAGTAYDPCDSAPGTPAIAVDPPVLIGSIGDPTNPAATLTVSDKDGAVEDLVVTVESSDDGVLPAANVTVQGSGETRTVVFEPAGRGTTSLIFTVTDADDNQASAMMTYAASNQAPDPTGRYHHHISDASSALDVGDGHMLLINDETNTIFLHRMNESGSPAKTWTFSAQQLGTSSEIDFESMARSGGLLLIAGSHGNSRSGDARPERQTLVAATIDGDGADTELTFLGRYNGLWNDLREWDQNDGHGLGADALGFVAATADGVQPNPPSGFNIEAFEFAPDGETLYLGFRAPTIQVEDNYRALIVPVLTAADIIDGGPASFGTPLFLDLDGRSIRALRANEHGEYLIVAGPSPQNDGWALYTWNGDPARDAHFNRSLPDPDPLTGGSWEGLPAVPHPLQEGAEVRVLADSGDTNFYGTGPTKDLPPAYQKSYSQYFILEAMPLTDVIFENRFEQGDTP